MGNITSRSDIGSGTAWSYDPTHKHQVTSIAGVGLVYSYDSNGNVTSRSGGTITMASYNYPTSISVVSPVGSETVALTYGPDRARWQQQYSSVNFGNPATTNYIGGLMEQVISGGVTTYRHYIYAGGEPVAIYARTSSGTNTFNYFLSDHQGSVAAITASNGTLVVAESNTPFGERRAPSTWVDPAITSTGWTGQVSDADIIASTAVTQQGYTFQTMLGMFMGLNHMNGRVQDAITGRFLSADPNIPDPTDTQDYNRYSYVRNNPLTLVDPSGFDASNNCSTDADGNTTCNVTANRYVPAGPGLNGANLWLPDPQEILFLNLAFAAIQKALEELQKPCGVPQQIGGTIQNAAAAAINGKTISFGFDQVASNGSEIRYSNSSFAVNTYGQFIRSYGDSTAMDGVVFGYMVGVGPGVYQNFSGPVQSSTGTSYVAVGGVAVAAEGAVVALSVDADSAGGSAPPVVPHLDYTIGFGAGAAHGSVSTTTIATLPRIPSIPTSTCHL
jgi:RHS repeat-associated protein